MSVHLNSVSTQTVTTCQAAQQASVVREIQGELETEKTEIGKAVSFAETTKVFVDDTVRKKLKLYGESKIKSWTGKGINLGAKTISVRDARMINEKAGVQVIDLNAENIKIDRFTIDDVIREQLENITNLAKPCRELGFWAGELSDIKKGRSITIGKEHADAYNSYFERNVFDSKRIFQLALTEPIFEKEKKLSEHTWIAIEVEHRKELMLLPNKKEIRRWIGGRVSAVISEVQITITVKDAVLIHKISGKTIFTFNEEAVAKIPILPAHLDELESLIQKFDDERKNLDRTIRRKIHYFKSRNQKEVARELAEEINALVGKKVFDLKSILDQAVQEAEAEAEEMQLSSPSKKRSRTDGSSEQKLKKQRTDTALDATQITPAASLSSYQFQYPVAPPQAPQNPKRSFDLEFILN